MVGKRLRFLRRSECSTQAIIRIFLVITFIVAGILPVMADDSETVKLIVYSSKNDSSELYNPIPPDVPLPPDIIYSHRSPELGFIVVNTDPNETVWITNELLNMPWVHAVEKDADRVSGAIIRDAENVSNILEQRAFSRIGLDTLVNNISTAKPCRIGLIDTGIDTRHHEFSHTNISGYDWALQSNVVYDTDGHGTALAGIVTIIGTISTPDREFPIEIIPQKIGVSSDTLSGVLSALAIVNATDLGADIILMGYGGTEPSLAEERAIAYAGEKGILLIAPAGNNDSNTVHYPSDNPGVISVGSIGNTDGLSYFSNYGIFTELVAPGEDIITTCPDDSFCIGSGTSFAAGEVAGIASLLMSAVPGLTGDEVRLILQRSATDLGRTGRDIYYGYGLINGEAAFKDAQNIKLQKTLKSYSLLPSAKYNKRNQNIRSSIQKMLELHSGWNFVSIPSPLRSGKTCKDLFSMVNTDSHTIWTYRLSDGGWLSKLADDTITPLEGILIYSEKPTSVPLIMEYQVNVSFPLTKGWNLVGSPSHEILSARDAFDSDNLSWVSLLGFNASLQQYESAIINGASGKYSDTRDVSPLSSFWIYANSDGIITRKYM